MDKLKIETKVGKLFAEITGHDEYPGVWIGIERGDSKIAFLLVEVDQSEEKPVLHIREWPIDKEGVWDDPTHSTDASAEQVDDMFSEEE